MQSAFTVCSAMCFKSSSFSSIKNNMAPHAVEANTMKAYVTDLMQESAQMLTQLEGAKGYRAESFGGRGIMDSRPFQIFEGSNEMLYSQIAEIVAKLMLRKKIPNLFEFLSQYDLTDKVAEQFKSMINFKIEGKLPQRKLVNLGRMLARMVSAQYVVNLGEGGFRPDLIRDCLETLKYDVSRFVSSFKFTTDVDPIEGYKDGGAWMELC
jgi:hypothetical protein